MVRILDEQLHTTNNLGLQIGNLKHSMVRPHRMEFLVQVERHPSVNSRHKIYSTMCKEINRPLLLLLLLLLLLPLPPPPLPLPRTSKSKEGFHSCRVR